MDLTEAQDVHVLLQLQHRNVLILTRDLGVPAAFHVFGSVLAPARSVALVVQTEISLHRELHLGLSGRRQAGVAEQAGWSRSQFAAQPLPAWYDQQI